MQPGDAPRPQSQHRLSCARHVSEQLKARFGAQRVILFGSIVDPEWFDADSDVDLAVEGLAPEDYWQAWALAEDIIADRSVDLIEIETARPSLSRLFGAME